MNKQENNVFLDLKKLPEEVKKIIREIIQIFNLNNVTLIAVGSLARYELAYYYENGEFILRSDMEFYAVTDNVNRVKSICVPKIKKIESKYSEKWQGFHIDISFMTYKKFKKLSLWIRHFELKKNGKIIVGENIITFAPGITINNLDFYELNEVVLWRMLLLVMKIDIHKFLKQSPTFLENYKYILTKSLLDFTTWTLPGLGVLLPTFNERVEFWGQNQKKIKKNGLLFVEKELMFEALASRRKKYVNYDFNILFLKTLKAWLQAFEVVIGQREALHKGRGLGFRKIDIFRRNRFVYRISKKFFSLIFQTFKDGPFMLSGYVAMYLLQALIDFSNPKLRKKYIIEAGKVLKMSDIKGTISDFEEIRLLLADYIDMALNNNEWKRHIPKKGGRE